MQHPFFGTINWEDIYNKRVIVFGWIDVNLTYQNTCTMYCHTPPRSKFWYQLLVNSTEYSFPAVQQLTQNNPGPESSVESLMEL